jgi:hypothetical protein
VKTAHFFLGITIALTLLPGTIAARQAPSQQPSSQSAEKSSSDNSIDAQRTKTEQKPSRKQITAGQHPVISYSKSVPTHQPRPSKTAITSSVPPSVPGSLAGIQQPKSKTNSSTSYIAANHRSAITPTTNAALSGQQFKNSRNPGARLASSGGTSTTARGTAALSGTNMKPKP